MKLLLTSAGVTNQSIADSLIELVGKNPGDIKIGFIPTAKNIESNNAPWRVDPNYFRRCMGEDS